MVKVPILARLEALRDEELDERREKRRRQAAEEEAKGTERGPEDKDGSDAQVRGTPNILLTHPPPQKNKTGGGRGPFTPRPQSPSPLQQDAASKAATASTDVTPPGNPPPPPTFLNFMAPSISNVPRCTPLTPQNPLTPLSRPPLDLAPRGLR